MIPLRQTPLPRHKSADAETQTIALIYPGVTAKQFRESLEAYRGVCRLQTVASPSGAEPGHRRPCPATPPTSPTSAARCSARRPAGECAVSSTVLDGLVDQAVPKAVEKIGALFRAAAGEEPLDGWFDRDFSGK